MSDMDPDLLEALSNLMGIQKPSVVQDDQDDPDEDFVHRLERAERLANGLGKE